MAHKPILLRFARVAAVLVALSVLGYLAFEAQRRANPPARAGAQPNTGAVDTGMQHGPPLAEPDVFLPSSKSGAVHFPEGFEIHENEAPEGTSYLSSSKFIAIDLPLPPGTEAQGEEEAESEHAEEAP